MENKVKSMLLAIGIFILSSAFPALAEDFSADMISTSKNQSFKGKIFMGKDKTRMETPESISITRMDRKLVWILMPKEKKYMEQAFDPSKAVATSEKVSGEIERKLIGQEKIDGRMTNKYQVTYTQNKKKYEIFQWFAPGFTFPVKTAAVDNSWIMEYKNIKKAKQPDSLFEVPAGYEKFSYQKPAMKDILKGFIR